MLSGSLSLMYLDPEVVLRARQASHTRGVGVRVQLRPEVTGMSRPSFSVSPAAWRSGICFGTNRAGGLDPAGGLLHSHTLQGLGDSRTLFYSEPLRLAASGKEVPHVRRMLNPVMHDWNS